jgi:hypothetical protein
VSPKRAKARNRTGRRVTVHVGLPKTGTTFLQASLSQNRKALRAAGTQYPSGEGRMFLAALDVRGTYDGWGRTAEETVDSWLDLCRRAVDFDGDTVISHELLAAAPQDRIEEAMAQLDGFDLHVVVTARDLARQAIAEWQEGIKHGRRLSFAKFTSKVLAVDAETEHAERFRASQDLPAVLERWAGVIPPGNLHVVTCPPRGAGSDVLWSRFCDAVTIDGTAFPPAGSESLNPSLGVNEIDLLRRVNKALDHRIQQPAYGQVVKEYFAQGLLARQTSPRPTLPMELYPAVADIGERWVKEVEAAGYRVHGDLADLVAQPPETASPHPDAVDREAQAAATAQVLADLLVDVVLGRREIDRLTDEGDALRTKRKRLRRKLAAARKG